MKSIVILLISANCMLISANCKAQDYVANWQTGQESWVVNGKKIGVAYYIVQKSADTLNWVTVKSVDPKKQAVNTYSYNLTASATGYYRVRAMYTWADWTTTKPIKVVNTNVFITKAFLKIIAATYDQLTFTATGEAAVSYYSIERSNNGGMWAEVGKVTQTALKNYSINVAKVGTTRKYRVRAFYTQGLVSPYINFN